VRQVWLGVSGVVHTVSQNQARMVRQGQAGMESGHNQPPDMAVTAVETAKDLSDWMAENPVIENEDQARGAKLFIDRGSLCIKDLEDERKTKVRPFMEEVNQLNSHYRSPRESLNSILSILKSRMGAYLHAEETKRLRVAEETARIAEQAEEVAREAERKEREVIEAAAHGELGLDILNATGQADQAFKDYQKADRQAALAERETKVRVGGGFTRALGLRNRECIIINDPIAAIQDIGLRNEIILDAIETASRAYKKLNGRYPDGVGSIMTREV
jgi:hypothetical protein